MTISKLISSMILGSLVLAACGSGAKKEPKAAPPPADSVDVAPVPPSSAASSAPSASASAAPEPPKTDTKQADCDSLAADASSSLDAKRIEFAEKSCKKDADCIAVKAHACSFACANGAVPKAQEKAWNDAVSKVKDGQCKKWTDNACDKLKSPPTCQDKKATCDKGHCAVK
jgi:hypothetical protein